MAEQASFSLRNRNPDVLHCIANLSNDEVFTPPELANQMLETETLWRPLDAIVAEHKDALANAEAAGLIVRSGPKVGFSHQSWLDDFQAKSFKTGTDLAEYPRIPDRSPED